MSSGDFLSWLFSDAGAGWVFGIVSLLAVIISYVGRKRPNRIVIREVLRSTLGNFMGEFKKDIQILVDGKRVFQLGQIDVEIYSEGSTPVTAPVITLTVPAHSKILDVAVEAQDDCLATSEIVNNKGIIKIPFLNPVREHGHFLKASIIVDGNMDNVEVTGSGVGWSVRHLRTIATDEVVSRMFLFLLGSIFLVFIGDLYYKFIESRFSVNPAEWSLKSLLYALPFLLVFGLFGWWFIRPFKASIGTLTGKRRK